MGEHHFVGHRGIAGSAGPGSVFHTWRRRCSRWAKGVPMSSGNDCRYLVDSVAAALESFATGGFA